MTTETFNSSPLDGRESLNEDLDTKLQSIFVRYQSEGRIVDGKISGVDYSRLQQEVQAAFPEITAAVFNPYLFEHRSVMIHGRPDRKWKTAPQSTRKVIRPAPESRTSSKTSDTSKISFKNKAAGDDTPDLF